MPTVDDLVISLTVKPTSELGKLKKMLDELAKPQGAGRQLLKQFEAKMPLSLQDDINFIKRNVVFLMPTRVPSKEQPRAMAETARRQIAELKQDVDRYVEKLIPQKDASYQKMLDDFGAKDRQDLKRILREDISKWSFYLQRIVSQDWIDDKAQLFMSEIDNLITLGETEIGERKNLIAKIEKRISEQRQLIANYFRSKGVEVLEERWFSKLRENIAVDFGQTIAGEFRSAEELLRHINFTSEESEKFLKELYNTVGMGAGTLKVLETAANMMGKDVFDLMKVSEQDIKNDEKLMAVAAILLREMLPTGKEVGQPKGAPKQFQGILQAILKNVYTQTVQASKITNEKMREMMEKASEKRVKNWSDRNFNRTRTLFESGVIDILLDKIEDIEDFEKVFSKEMIEKFQEGLTFLEMKGVLTGQEQQIAKTQRYERLYGKESLVYFASQIVGEWKNMFPDIIVGKLQNLWEVSGKKQLTEEELMKVFKENLKDIPDEKAIKTMMDSIKSSISYLTKPITEEEKELSEEQKELSERISDDMLLKLISSPDWQEQKMTPEKIIEEIKVNETIKELQEDMSNEELKKALNNAFILMLEKMSAIYSQLTKRGKESLFSQETKVEPEVK